MNTVYAVNYHYIRTLQPVKQWIFSEPRYTKLKFQEKSCIKGCGPWPNDQTIIWKYWSQQKHETAKAKAAKGVERGGKLCNHVVPSYQFNTVLHFCLGPFDSWVQVEGGETIHSSKGMRKVHACFDLQYLFCYKVSFHRLHEEKDWKEDTFWSNAELLSIDKDHERKHLNTLYRHRLKFMGTEGIHPEEQRELANITEGHCLIFGRPWWLREAPEYWKKARRRIWQMQASHPHLDPWEDEGV